MTYTVEVLKKIESWAKAHVLPVRWVDDNQIRIEVGTVIDPIGLHYDTIWTEPLLGFVHVSQVPRVLEVVENIDKMLKES